MDLIDIHAHILPTIDDGPETLPKALEMAKQASEDGIQIIIATPHVIPGEHDLSKEKINAAIEQFNKELRNHEINLEVLPGAENYLDLDIPSKLSRGEIMTLNNGGKYLLIELPMQSFPNYTEKVLFDLRLKGITPIIAHPERNLAITERPELLYNLVSKGILCQINSTSVTGAFGRNVAACAKLLLEHNWVHFIATDCHSCGTRGPRLKAAYNMVSNILGRARAEELVLINPQKVISGEDINIGDIKEYTPDKGLWKRIKSKLFL